MTRYIITDTRTGEVKDTGRLGFLIWYWFADQSPRRVRKRRYY